MSKRLITVQQRNSLRNETLSTHKISIISNDTKIFETKKKSKTKENMQTTKISIISNAYVEIFEAKKKRQTINHMQCNPASRSQFMEIESENLHENLNTTR